MITNNKIKTTAEAITMLMRWLVITLIVTALLGNESVGNVVIIKPAIVEISLDINYLTNAFDIQFTIRIENRC